METLRKYQTETINRGDIFFADLGSGEGSEQSGFRPVVIIQNNMGNKHSSTVIVAALTSKIKKSRIPTHVEVSRYDNTGLVKDSVVLLEQIRTIDKRKLKHKIGKCSYERLESIDKAIKVSLGIQLNHNYLENDIINRRFEENIPKEVFDISKVERMKKAIEELKTFVNKYKDLNLDMTVINNNIKIQYRELREYCVKFGQTVENVYN